MYPVSAVQPSKRKIAQPSKKQPVINDAQSKQIMNQLLVDLDQNEVEDLEERNKTAIVREQVYNSSGQVALSKQEEMQFQAETVHAGGQQNDKPVVTGANPFSKKRKLTEITQQEQSTRPNGADVGNCEESNGVAQTESEAPANNGGGVEHPSTKMQVDQSN